MKFPKYRRSRKSMKRLYDWFHNYYGSIERSLGPKLDAVLDAVGVEVACAERQTALEYACGSGLLTLKLARFFASVAGRDQSEGMIGRAQARAREAGVRNVSFRLGNILGPDEQPGSYDCVFVSFAMHLFPPEEEIRILKRLLLVARSAVVVIDHGRKWEFFTAVIEWFEGGYYDTFIRQDFRRYADAIGAASFVEKQVKGCTVLIFRK
jgi:SAM-dependent methyltransferase